jgi:phage-related baseplate assembly protein
MRPDGDPMSDLVGRIGPAHPEYTRNGARSPGYHYVIDAAGNVYERTDLGLRNRIREAIEELEAAGHNGCAEIVRARMWHG